jgi:riboflavin transporter FmnP
MRKLMNYLLLGLIAMFLFTYTMGLFDDTFRKTGVWYKDILASIKYYVTWVLPYWWLIILIGSIVLALIFYGVKIGVDKIKG